MSITHRQPERDGNREASRGFTLIEIIVSLGIFSIVAVVALGALIKIIDTNKKAQTLLASLTNLNYAIESMSRELRTGTGYYCDSASTGNLSANFAPSASNCAAANLIAFRSSKRGSVSAGVEPSCNLAYAYLFTATSTGYVLKKAQQRYCGDSFTSASYYPIISSDITLLKYRVSAYADPTQFAYPLVSLYLSGYAGSRERERTYFDVQTAISPIIP